MSNRIKLIIAGLVILMGMGTAGGFVGYGIAQEEVGRLEAKVGELRFLHDISITALDTRDEAAGQIEEDIRIKDEHIEWLDRWVKRLKDNPIIEEVLVEVEKVEQPAAEEVPVYISDNSTRKLLDGWNDLEELRRFIYFEDDTDKLDIRGDGMNTSFLYAARLRLNAEKAGKYLAFQYLPEDNSYFCSAVVDGSIFYIDPRTDKVWWVADWR